MALSNDEQVALANKLMRLINGLSPNGVGLTLLVYPLDKPGLITYISNSQREDMKESIQCLLDNWNEEDDV